MPLAYHANTIARYYNHHTASFYISTLVSTTQRFSKVAGNGCSNEQNIMDSFFGISKATFLNTHVVPANDNDVFNDGKCAFCKFIIASEQ